MKRLIVLFTLLYGVCAFAQHPLSAERQALIRKLSLPVLADTLEYARKNKELNNTDDSYGQYVTSTSVLQYSVKDADIYLKWPIRVDARSNTSEPMGIGTISSLAHSPDSTMTEIIDRCHSAGKPFYAILNSRFGLRFNCQLPIE